MRTPERSGYLRREFLVVLQIAVAILTICSVTMQVCIAKPQSQGEILVNKNACKNCHLIGGSGSNLGPPLDGISKHRNKKYIEEMLRSNKRKPIVGSYPIPASLMAHVHTSAPEASSIADYLLGLPEIKYKVNGHDSPIPTSAPAGSHYKPEPTSSSSKEGLALFKSKSCIACHSVGSIGGHLGPDLAGVGARRSRAYIIDRISKGAVLLPQPGQASGRQLMPPSKLSDREKGNLTNWLLTLPAN